MCVCACACVWDSSVLRAFNIFRGDQPHEACGKRKKLNDELCTMLHHYRKYMYKDVKWLTFCSTSIQTIESYVKADDVFFFLYIHQSLYTIRSDKISIFCRSCLNRYILHENVMRLIILFTFYIYIWPYCHSYDKWIYFFKKSTRLSQAERQDNNEKFTNCSHLD